MQKDDLVLTLNHADSQSQELARFARKRNPIIRIAAVRGFGAPELRVGTSAYVRGVERIQQEILRLARA